jgi:hypothetical protein
MCLLHDIVIDKEGLDKVALMALQSSTSSAAHTNIPEHYTELQSIHPSFTATEVRNSFKVFLVPTNKETSPWQTSLNVAFVNCKQRTFF